MIFAQALASMAIAIEIRIVPGVSFVPPPSKPSGPDLFITVHPLKGQCFSRTQHPFEYTLCPFNNVTQKTVHSDKDHWTLGVWHKWSLGKWRPQKDESLLSLFLT
jgi:hypothetical protein